MMARTSTQDTRKIHTTHTHKTRMGKSGNQPASRPIPPRIYVYLVHLDRRRVSLRELVDRLLLLEERVVQLFRR